MPIHRRLPKRGFKNTNKIIYTELNLGKIQTLINSKKIDPKKIISFQTFIDLGLIKSNQSKIKLLANGKIIDKIDIETSSLSKSARESIEKVGGSITIIGSKKSIPNKDNQSGV